MFSDHVGSRLVVRGREILRVDAGVTGHIVHGQHQHVRPGIFRVEFDVALKEHPSADNPRTIPCAILEVAAYRGVTVLASETLLISDLSADIRTFAIDFTNYEFRSLEYRIYATGAAGLLVGEPRLVRTAETPGSPPDPDPDAPTTDPVELNRQVRKVMRLLEPICVRGLKKIRLGNAGDGGYVCLDDFEGIDTALSLGINDDISWDLDVADRGVTIHQFDHTVDDPAPHDGRMIFNKTAIAPATSPGQAGLQDLIVRHDAGRAKPNMILKMDIEGAEWPVLAATDEHSLGRFSQILCELHSFDQLRYDDGRRLLHHCLRKLSTNYAVAHVHANVCGGISNIANVLLPNVLELTFVNRSLFDVGPTDEVFPGPLDISCDAYQPDMFLGAFRF